MFPRNPENILNNKTRTIAKFYDQEAADYDELRWQSNSGAHTNAVQIEIVSQLLDNIDSKKILEVGIGTGRITRYLNWQGKSVTGVDISLAMLDRAAKNLLPGNIFVQSDGLYLPFQSNSFDYCLSINVFSHLTDFKGALREIARVLCSRGSLVLNFPNVLSYYLPAGLIVNARSKSIKRNVYTHWYTFKEFYSACDQAGLRIESVTGQVHLPSWSSNVVVRSGLKYLDRLSRKSFLRYISPTLFVKAVKKN